MNSSAQLLLFDLRSDPKLDQCPDAEPVARHSRTPVPPEPVAPPPSSLVPPEQAVPPPPAPAPTEPALVLVRDARARRYLIRVRADGTVRVTIPRRGSKREALAFVERQQQWIRTQQQRLAEWRKNLPPDLPEAEQRELRARAQRELPARLLELAAEIGLAVQKVSVRNQRRRWGSCSSSGLICLNWRLITMPGWVRDYVMYHELMHLKCMNHSPRFWKLVAAVCPDYERACEWLRRHGHAPHAASCAVPDRIRGDGADAAADMVSQSAAADRAPQGVTID